MGSCCTCSKSKENRAGYLFRLQDARFDLQHGRHKGFADACTWRGAVYLAYRDGEHEACVFPPGDPRHGQPVPEVVRVCRSWDGGRTWLPDQQWTLLLDQQGAGFTRGAHFAPTSTKLVLICHGGVLRNDSLVPTTWLAASGSGADWPTMTQVTGDATQMMLWRPKFLDQQSSWFAVGSAPATEDAVLFRSADAVTWICHAVLSGIGDEVELFHTVDERLFAFGRHGGKPGKLMQASPTSGYTSWRAHHIQPEIMLHGCTVFQLGERVMAIVRSNIAGRRQTLAYWIEGLLACDSSAFHFDDHISRVFSRPTGIPVTLDLHIQASGKES